jgi:hypothetical protein
VESYIEVLKGQVKHLWSLHALCVAPRYDEERVREVRGELAKLQSEERDALAGMRLAFGQP